jgi:hypothetical protein
MKAMITVSSIVPIVPRSITIAKEQEELVGNCLAPGG